MNKEKVVRAITEQGILPLYFHPDEDISIETLRTLYESGIRVVEYTNRGKQALKNLRALAKKKYDLFPDLILGMGTVLDIKAGAKAIQNGADFLVSPGYSSDLSKFADDERILWIPGCITPTELMMAQTDGLNLVKIFPANTVGVGFVRSAREVFPDLLFMPTGGIGYEDIESWFKAGVSAIGMGGSLISNQILEQNDWALLEVNTRTLLNRIADIRSSII